MSFGSLFRKAAGGLKSLSKIPGVGMIPGVGNVLSAVGTAASVYSAVSAGSKLLGGLTGGGGGGAGGAGSAGSLPALPGMGMMPTTSSIAPGSRSIFRNDPNVIEALKQFAIPKAALKAYYRAPKGFIVKYDQVGDPYGLPKNVAKAYHMWKPAKKPLLSVRDTNAIRHAGRAIKKLQHAEKMAKHIANWHSGPRKAPRTNIIIEKKGHK